MHHPFLWAGLIVYAVQLWRDLHGLHFVHPNIFPLELTLRRKLILDVYSRDYGPQFVHLDIFVFELARSSPSPCKHRPFSWEWLSI